MRDVTVMNIIGLEFLSNEAKKLVKSVVGLSKKMLKTCLKIQYNAAVFPIYFLYGGLKYVYEQSFASDSDREPSLEPKNGVILSAVQQLRNSVVSAINCISSSKRDTGAAPITLNNSVSNNERQSGDALPEQIPDIAQQERLMESSDNPQIVPLCVSDFSGCDLMWDVPIISAKAKYFTRCLKERNMDGIAVARKALEEHAINNPMPKTRREYDKFMKAKNGLGYFSNDAESRCVCKRNTAASTKLTSNILEKNTHKKLEISSDGTNSDRYFQRPKNTECVCDPKLIQGKIMRFEIETIGWKLKRIHETCSSLLKGLLTLNEHLSKYVSMKEKIAKLENDVKEGRKLLKEVDYDRSMMLTKLLALDELITEEQQFLFESSCESGFYETETNARTVDELSAFKNVPNLCTSQNH